MATNVKRAYRSDRRAQQAKETRRAIRDAAQRLFVEQGYTATSISEIAESAGVAPETVYATFKNKRALLKEVVDVGIAGDDEPIPVNARPWLDEVRAVTDARERTRMLNRAGFERVARVGPVAEVLRSAAATDPALAELWDENQRNRRADIETFVSLVAECGPLRYDEETLVDLIWAIGGSEVYHALVVERGWPKERYIDLLDDVVTRIGLE